MGGKTSTQEYAGKSRALIMDVKKARTVLAKYFMIEGKSICEMHKAMHGIPDDEMKHTLKRYIEYILLKAIVSDIGTEECGGMKLSASPEVDALWHTHVLCTEQYLAFMGKVRLVNPLVETLHHSLKGSFDSDEVKAKRREVTRAAHRRVFGEECGWIAVDEKRDTPENDNAKERVGDVTFIYSPPPSVTFTRKAVKYC